MPEVDGQGRGGNGNCLATQDTKGSTDSGCKEEMVSGQEPAAAPSPHRARQRKRGEM